MTKAIQQKESTKIQQELGKFTPEQVDLIKRIICKDATNDELALFINQCNRTGLDPFSRQIYSIKRKQKNSDGTYSDVRTTQVSIDGLRLIAERSGKYSGQTPVYWCGTDGVWVDVWTKNELPHAAKIGIYRSDFKKSVYAVALLRSYAQSYNGQLSSFWQKMPELMIGKVAEALALRKCFPQEMSGLYTSEEIPPAENMPAENPIKVKAKIKTDEFTADLNEPADEEKADIIRLQKEEELKNKLK